MFRNLSLDTLFLKKRHTELLRKRIMDIRLIQRQLSSHVQKSYKRFLLIKPQNIGDFLLTLFNCTLKKNLDHFRSKNKSPRRQLGVYLGFFKDFPMENTLTAVTYERVRT